MYSSSAGPLLHCLLSKVIVWRNELGVYQRAHTCVGVCVGAATCCKFWVCDITINITQVGVTFMGPFPRTGSCLPWIRFFSSFYHIFTLVLPPPPPPHPSASLPLNLETPPFSPPPSSHSHSLSFSPATCHRSLSRSSLQTADPLPSFFFTPFPASCFTRRLSFSRSNFSLPFLLPCSPNFYFTKKSHNLHLKPKSRK